MKYSIIGFGGRGCMYSYYFKDNEAQLTAVCDIRKERLELAKGIHKLNDNQLYDNLDEFFTGEQKSELCIIATQDDSHHQIALRALRSGYDLMLEKPIAQTQEECQEIYDCAKENGRKVFICHVLRYAPFFMTIKNELSSGKYGRVSTINLTENVAYWHQAHSYVRGNWRRCDESTPMIAAKCCHDLDILVWLIEKDCKGVSSMGSLSLFKKENQPDGASDRCVICKYKDTCAYSASKFYLEKYDNGERGWPCDVLTTNLNRENLVKALEEGPYGRCVFACDNDVVDHQVVNMEFDDFITAHLTMTAFSKDSYREIHVHAEYGEIYGNMEENVLHCNVFGGESKIIDINAIMGEEGMAGHGGGDGRLVKDIVESYEGKSGVGLTTIEKSMLSHKIAFAAEESRLEKGKLIKL